LGPALGVKPPAFGFHGGFRDGADGPRRLLLAGIFPDRGIKLCELKEAAEVSGVLVQPIAQLRDIRDAPFVGAAAIGGGFAAGLGGAPAGTPEFKPFAPFFSMGGAPGHPGTVDFSVAGGAPDDAALVLPFWTPIAAAGKSVAFVMGDGTRLTAPLMPWWSLGYWRAAVLPAALARQHGGAVRIEVRDAGPGWIAVATPRIAMPRSGWSLLY
jgi:hypothetical protein